MSEEEFYLYVLIHILLVMSEESNFIFNFLPTCNYIMYMYLLETLFNFNIRMNEDNFMCIKIKNKYYPVKLRNIHISMLLIILIC